MEGCLTPAVSGTAFVAERGAPLGVGRVDEMPVALDVAALAADDDDDRVLVERVGDLARRLGLAVEEPAGVEITCLPLDFDTHAASVHEVELVLRVVEVPDAVVAGRIHDRVHTEGGHTQCRADLAEAVAVSELVERGERVAHSVSLQAPASASGSRPSSSASAALSSALNREPKSSSMSVRWDSCASSNFLRPTFVRTAYVTRAS